MCEGNIVSVLFCNEHVEFIVEKLVPVSQKLEPDMDSRLSFNTSKDLTARLEDSLRLDMSGLCLGEQRGRSCSPARPGTSSHQQIITSTPRMDVDEAPACSGVESRQLGGPHLEPNQTTHRGGNTLSLEHQMQELGLADCESGSRGRGGNHCLHEGEEGLVEVMACKITTKTKIVFLEDSRDGNEVRMIVFTFICQMQRHVHYVRVVW